MPAVVLLAGVVTPTAPAAAATLGYGQPETRCTITDDRLPELSGLVSDGDDLLAMDDGGSRVEVYVLDARCRVRDVRTADVDPYDPEDLGLGSDGTVWLADTGDNDRRRATVAMIGLHPDGSTTLTRLTYPDGAHDTESLLLAPDGTPYLVTKEVLGASAIYRPDAVLRNGVTLPLSKVGNVDFTLTGTTGGPVGSVGQLLATGGAVSADGAYVALRTYTDAYVWPLTGSDVAGALAAKPVRVALPAEPQGEAISFAPDDRGLLVSGEGLPAVVTEVPATGASGSGMPTTSPAGDPAADGSADTGAKAGSRSAPLVPALLVAAGLAAALTWLGSRWWRRS